MDQFILYMQPVIFGAWIAIGIASTVLFVFSNNGPLKIKVWPTFMIIFVIAGILSFYIIGGSFALAIFGPLIAMFGFINIQWVHFCPHCAKSVIIPAFKKSMAPKRCPHCQKIMD